MIRVDHIGIAVSSIEQALPFLTETLRLEKLGEPARIPGEQLSVQFVGCGDGKLELLAPDGASGPVQRYLDRRGEGLMHVCLEVDDIHAEFERLRALGVRFADERPWMSPHGWAAFIHPKAWSGVSIELRQFS